jgi:hypothetical protein
MKEIKKKKFTYGPNDDFAVVWGSFRRRGFFPVDIP